MLKNLRSLFIKDEPTVEQAVPEQVTPKESEKKTPAAAPTSYAPVTPPPIPQNATHDQRIFDSLQKALEDNNQDGFDFMEFKGSLKTLSGLISDEATRYKSAYATAATLGVTTDKLLQSASFYKGILDKERDNFNKAFSQQVDVNVTGKQKEAERLQALITQKSQEIARLTQEITAHQEELSKAKDVITEAQTKIETTKNNFNLTMDTVMNQIQTDIDNIQKYLKANPHKP